MGIFEKIFARHWGVHPQDHKRPAADARVRVVPLPPRLVVPLLQHIGTAARPRVLVGQKVLKGECLAEAQGNISAPIHAPTSGTVIAIDEVTAPHPSGLPVLAISIAPDGEDRWAPADILPDPFAATAEEIAQRIADAGIVGLGGATFPSAVKLSLGYKCKIETLILNGSECEPYLSCDDRVMRDHADAIILGARIMLHATGARQALVGIEDNKPEAIASMQTAVAAYPEVKVCVVPARYPMGSERQLITELTGLEVPMDARSADIGVLVHNVGTARAVQQAICLGRPLVSRLVTLNGGAMVAPGNYEVTIGTLVSDLLAFAGGFREEPKRLIMGGPMMGLVLPHTRVPVVKGTCGILAFSAVEAAEHEEGNCIRCGSCVSACPMGLVPMEMAAHIRADKPDGARKIGLADCMACGCCAYVCPAHIPLVQYFAHAKGRLSEQTRGQLRQEATKKLATARHERLDREARERAEAAAKRKAERAAQVAATEGVKA